MNKFIDTLKIDSNNTSPDKDKYSGHKNEKNRPNLIAKTKLLAKRKFRLGITLFLVLGATIFGIIFLLNKNDEKNIVAEEPESTQVKTIIIDLSRESAIQFEAVGTVKAESKIDVTALANGTVRNINFEVGDQVTTNQVLASLSDREASVSLINAKTNLSNQQSNLAVTNLITNENIRQAEAGVLTTEDSITTAEVALKTTQNNLANAKALRDKGNYDIKNNSIIAFNGYLNTIDSALDQVDFILNVEDENQLPGIAPVLGVKKLSSINTARSDYHSAKNNFTNLLSKSLSTSNVANSMTDMINALALTKKLVDNTIVVLDNTISSADFSEAVLLAQKSNFIALRTNIVNTQAGAEGASQTLQNLSLVENQEIQALEDAIEIAEKQLEATRTNNISGLTSLEVIRQNNELQLIAAKSAIDAAQSQLDLARAHSADLSINAPISGTVTEKFVELGAEVSPGQKIAEISQTDLVIIEIDVSSEDIYKIEQGQEVIIAPESLALKATVNKIYPTANSVSKKIKVEIAYNNENNDLIPESFVRVHIFTTKVANSNSSSIFIPLRAVTITQTENFIYKVTGGTSDNAVLAKKTLVETGDIAGSLIEIIEGVSDGDELIIEGNKTINDGEKIVVIN